jgi:hypothetical protein
MPGEAKLPNVETQSPSRLPAVEELTPTQRKEYEKLRALSRESAKHKLPGATSDQEDMYDAFGLPK